MFNDSFRKLHFGTAAENISPIDSSLAENSSRPDSLLQHRFGGPLQIQFARTLVNLGLIESSQAFSAQSNLSAYFRKLGQDFSSDHYYQWKTRFLYCMNHSTQITAEVKTILAKGLISNGMFDFLAEHLGAFYREENVQAYNLHLLKFAVEVLREEQLDSKVRTELTVQIIDKCKKFDILVVKQREFLKSIILEILPRNSFEYKVGKMITNSIDKKLKNTTASVDILELIAETINREIKEQGLRPDSTNFERAITSELLDKIGNNLCFFNNFERTLLKKIVDHLAPDNKLISTVFEMLEGLLTDNKSGNSTFEFPSQQSSVSDQYYYMNKTKLLSPELKFDADPANIEDILQHEIELLKAKVRRLASTVETSDYLVAQEIIDNFESALHPSYLVFNYLTFLNIGNSTKFGDCYARASIMISNMEQKVFSNSTLGKFFCYVQHWYNGVFLGEEENFNPYNNLYVRLDLNLHTHPLLKELLNKFEFHGALAENSTHSSRIFLDLTLACNEYLKNLAEEALARRVWIDDESQLQGIPPERIAFYKELAIKDGRPAEWCILPIRHDVDQRQTDTDDPALRERITNARRNIGSPLAADGTPSAYDNSKPIETITSRYRRIAKNAGKIDFADFANSHSLIAKNHKFRQSGIYSAKDYVVEFIEKALPFFVEEVEQIAEFALSNTRSPLCNTREKILSEAHFSYFARQYYIDRGLNDQELSKYLNVETILENLSAPLQRDFGFRLVSEPQLEFHYFKNFGLDLKIYKIDYGHQEVLPNRLCFDLYSRPGKLDLAWAAEVPYWSFVITDIDKNHHGPTPTNLRQFPVLLHELGHSLLSCLTERGDPRGLYADVARVEIPSGILEHKALEYLPLIARHYQTGEKAPAEIIEPAQAYLRFLQRQQVLRLAVNGLKDILLHQTKNRNEIKFIDYFGNVAFKKPETRTMLIKFAPCIRPYSVLNWNHQAAQSPRFPGNYASYLYGWAMSDASNFKVPFNSYNGFGDFAMGFNMLSPSALANHLFEDWK